MKFKQQVKAALRAVAQRKEVQRLVAEAKVRAVGTELGKAPNRAARRAVGRARRGGSPGRAELQP